MESGLRHPWVTVSFRQRLFSVCLKVQSAIARSLLGKIFEIDHFLCTFGAQMKIVCFITEPRVVDRILRYLASEACKRAIAQPGFAGGALGGG
jgi:hypothetical protein